MDDSKKSSSNEQIDATERELRLKRRRPWEEERVKRKKRYLLLLLALLLFLFAFFGYYYRYGEAPIPKVAPAEGYPEPVYLFSIYGPLWEPTDVAINPINGDVYVANSRNAHISVYTPNGDYLFSFRDTGKGTPGLLDPVYLAINSKAEVYVSDRFRKAIFVFTDKGRFIKKLLPNNDKSFDDETNFRWAPTALWFDEKDNLYVTDILHEHQVWVISPKGKVLKKFGHFEQAQTRFQGESGFYYPHGVTTGKDGNIYVADSNNGRLQIFDKNGRFLSFVYTGGLPRGIVIDDLGRLLVVDVLSHQVRVFDLKGKPLLEFGKQGVRDAEFNYPNGIAVDVRRIYVTDRMNHRVQVWGWPLFVRVPLRRLPKIAFQWWYFLPLLLFPFLVGRRRRFAHADFLEKVVKEEAVADAQRKLKKLYVTPETHSRFKQYFADDFLVALDPNWDRVKDWLEERKFEIPLDAGALLFEARRSKARFKRVLVLVEDEELRMIAYRLKLYTYNFKETALYIFGWKPEREKKERRFFKRRKKKEKEEEE